MALFSALEQTHCTLVACDCSFSQRALNIHPSGEVVVLFVKWLVTLETAAISARSVYTIQPCTISLHAEPHTQGACVLSCNQPHIGRRTGIFKKSDRLLLCDLRDSSSSIRSPQVFGSTRLFLSSIITLEQSTLLSATLFFHSII